MLLFTLALICAEPYKALTLTHATFLVFVRFPQSMRYYLAVRVHGVAKHTLESCWQIRRNNAASVCEFSWNIRVSMAAASRLFAAVIAWMSPVMCRFISSMGTICEYPPPAAPPLMPKVGPWDGCRTHVNTCLPQCAPRAWHSPTVVVDLPSPRGVGVMPATTTAAQRRACAAGTDMDMWAVLQLRSAHHSAHLDGSSNGLQPLS